VVFGCGKQLGTRALSAHDTAYLHSQQCLITIMMVVQKSGQVKEGSASRVKGIPSARTNPHDHQDRKLSIQKPANLSDLHTGGGKIKRLILNQSCLWRM
jgi:hypothetical protein